MGFIMHVQYDFHTAAGYTGHYCGVLLDVTPREFGSSQEHNSLAGPFHTSKMNHNRVFALLIGIDNYKSGAIWNLNSCVDDAKKMRRWIRSLGVPEDQICMLLNNKATTKGIEDAFMSHLVNNERIEPGDAIIIYFAGHGSTIRPPPGWFQTGGGHVDILCSHDHDSRSPTGRTVGISDRSLCALLDDLAQVKGDNITLILDCSFSRQASNMRASTRWTSSRAAPEDLYAGLWTSARGSENPRVLFGVHSSSFTLLAACGHTGRSVESFAGGCFTDALLHLFQTVPLHRLTNQDIVDQLPPLEGPVCLGKYRKRSIFNAVPFPEEPTFVSLVNEKAGMVRVKLGAIHGVVIGSELSVHIHNHGNSFNPSIANISVEQVFPTYSLARRKLPQNKIPPGCWAKITHWNNHVPFGVYVKKTLTNIYSAWKLNHQIKSSDALKSGINISRVRHPKHADVTVVLDAGKLTIEDVQKKYSRVVPLHNGDTAIDAVDQTALFHKQLNLENPEHPLRNTTELELYRIDPVSWLRVGANILQPDGTADVPYEENAIFSLLMHNHSDKLDLWPQLMSMNAQNCRFTPIYHPMPSQTSSPPLRSRGGSVEVGTGDIGSEAITFNLPDHPTDSNAGFLKLFLSSSYVSLDALQYHYANFVGSSSQTTTDSLSNIVWDTFTVSVRFHK